MATDEGREGIELVMRDTGLGVPDKLREEIFNPFVTTKKTRCGPGAFYSFDRLNMATTDSFMLRTAPRAEPCLHCSFLGKARRPMTGHGLMGELRMTEFFGSSGQRRMNQRPDRY